MPDPILAEERRLARELQSLLLQARRQILKRYAEVGRDSSEAATLVEMSRAIDDALSKAREGMGKAALRGINRAWKAGVDRANRTLPERFRAEQRLNSFLLEAISGYQLPDIKNLTQRAAAEAKRMLQIALLAGKTAPEIARDMKGPLDGAVKRVESFAVSETNAIANQGIQARYSDAGKAIPGLKKQWISAHDGRVRPTHYLADGQTVGVDEHFMVGGYPAMHPGDRNLPRSERYGCRCRTVVVLPEEDEEAPQQQTVTTPAQPVPVSEAQQAAATPGSDEPVVVQEATPKVSGEAIPPEKPAREPKPYKRAATVEKAEAYARELGIQDVSYGDNLYMGNAVNKALAEAYAAGRPLPVLVWDDPVSVAMWQGGDRFGNTSVGQR